jgi:hypothetical protein
MADDDAPENEGGTTDPQSSDSDNGAQHQDTSDNSRDTRSSQESEQKQAAGKTYTQEDFDRAIAERTARYEKKFAGYDDLKKKAAEFDKWQDAQKSEVEKLNDQLATAQVELQGFRVAEIRRSAAEAAGLPAKYMKYITAADEAEALEQAKELAKDIKTPETKPADLKQGTRPHVPVAETKDSLIRRMAGYEVG